MNIADTVFEQVSQMFGVGVAEQLNEAGLLVSDPVDPVDSVFRRNQTHWMVRATYNGTAPLHNNINGYSYYPPSGLNNDFKSWIRKVSRPTAVGPRTHTKVYELSDKLQATRVRSMINNWGNQWGISAELIPVHALELL